MQDVAEKLKEMINENGPSYLSDEPYKVFKELQESRVTDKRTAGALLMLFATGIVDSIKKDTGVDALSDLIKAECCFNKRMSDRLADIVLTLYSKENKDEWKNKNKEGLVQFLEEDHTFTWQGFTIWDAGNCTMDCNYSAEIELHPTEKAGNNKELLKLLKKNPFMTKDAIYYFFEKKLKEYLDLEFEEYCTDDDYYEPVAEDFELSYEVDDWCKKNGFEVVYCEGDGETGEYEPKSRKGWF